MRKFGVLIAGAGPAGCAAAITLRRYLPELPVGIVSRKNSEGEYRFGESLGAGVLPLLNYLGLGERFFEQDHMPAYGLTSLWGPSPKRMERNSIFNPRGPGWILDRRRFDDGLLTEAIGLGLDYIQSTISKLVRVKDGFTLEINGEQVHAKYLIDATGRSAVLAKQLGGRVRPLDDLLANVEWFDTPGNAGSTMSGILIEAAQNGWFYSTELPGGAGVLAFFSDADTFRQGNVTGDKTIYTHLEHAPHTKERIAAWSSLGVEKLRTANSQYTEPACGCGWIAAGDAVAAFDPVSSLGIGFALQSGIEAARVAATANAPEEKVLRKHYALSVQAIVKDYVNRLRKIYMQNSTPEGRFWQKRRENLARII